MDKKHYVLNKIIMCGFIGYVIVLLVERILSVILSINGGDYPLTGGNWFSILTYVIMCVSLLAGVVLLIKPMAKIFKNLCKKNEYSIKEDYRSLILGSMVLLVSGMVHTSYTIAGVQFVAYGLLIAAMVARTVECCFDGGNKFDTILSVIYLSCFSMCIPVMYYTTNTEWYSVVFYIVEFLALAVILPVFSIMLYRFFDTGYSKFEVTFYSLMILFAGLTVGFGWKCNLNVFLLGAVVATAIAYLVYAIHLEKNKKKKITEAK